MTCHTASVRMPPRCSITGKDIHYDRESWNGRQWEDDERKRIARLESRGKDEWISNMLCVGIVSIVVVGVLALFVVLSFFGGAG